MRNQRFNQGKMPAFLQPPSQRDDIRSIYDTGEYLERNPDWHTHESPWKAELISEMLRRNALTPQTIAEIGCGAGEVLRQLQQRTPANCNFVGYELSAMAFRMCQNRANEKLTFRLKDIAEDEACFDLVLVLDVVEHLEDYFRFLRNIRKKGKWIIFHFPLDLSVQTILRPYGLLKRRDLHYHLHYFSKETALRTLVETGYRVLDYAYTARSNTFAKALIQKFLRVPRALLFCIHQDFAVRLLGGYSLLVLTMAGN
jgi:SAM-dependent methyltransferase